MRTLLLLIAGTLLLPLAWVLLRPVPPEPVVGLDPIREATQSGALRTLPDGALFDPDAPSGSGARRGVLLAPDGTLSGGTFDGAWRLHGPGWSRAPDGTRYEGGHDHGTRAGPGVAIEPDGTVHAGTWTGGTATGPGHRVSPRGRRFSGPFRDGRPDGRGWCLEGAEVWSCDEAGTRELGRSP